MAPADEDLSDEDLYQEDLSSEDSAYLDREVEIALEPYRALLSEEDVAFMRVALRENLVQDEALRVATLAAKPRAIDVSDVQPVPGAKRLAARKRTTKAQ
jgi:hypothetical protein